MDSFYGGRKGQDFSISKIFTTRTEMQSDLDKSWTSPISVGEYVIISYGLPSESNYDIYKSDDIQKYGKSYNSTLWQKIYTEDGTGSASGLSYKLLASMTGNTPRINLNTTVALDADQEPFVAWDNTDVDKLVLTFMLPKSQVLSLDTPAGVLDCDEQPTVIMDSSDVNFPVLYFALPQSQVIEQATVSWLPVGEDPQVELDITDINKPVLNFSLPVAQSLQEGQTTILNADESPYFDIDFTDINNPVLHFWLPQSQVMGNPETEVLGPETTPSVTLDSTDVNSPKLNFTLPRAVKFYYGSLLGERTAGQYIVTNDEFADYETGDYYINASTGFIYKVSAKNGTTCTFEYVACIQSPLPEVVAVGISPYAENEDGELEPAIPVVTRSFTNAEETAWKLEFQLPKAPNYDIAFEFIGVDEQGDVTVGPQDEDTVLFDFKIPRGSKLFTGEDIDDTNTSSAIVGAKPGDVYLNSVTGFVYQLNSANVWVKQTGGLKGPIGEALNIAKSYTITSAEVATDTLASVSAYVEADYGINNINEQDIFAVTYVDEEGNEISYWYFKSADGIWGRVQLTGGISNLIENEYNDEADGEVNNKTYSVHYVNALIGGEVETKNKDRVTYSAAQVEELLSWGKFSDLIP